MRRGLRRDRRGATAVSFAFTAMAFVTLLTLTIETGWQLAIGAGLDHGTRVAARWAATGQAAPSGSTKEQEIARIVRTASGMPIQSQFLSVTATAFSSLTNLTGNTGGVSGTGSSAQMVRYAVIYNAPPLTPIARGVVPKGVITHSFSVVVRNEPYSITP